MHVSSLYIILCYYYVGIYAAMDVIWLILTNITSIDLLAVHMYISNYQLTPLIL